jgi:predicted DCC family thiol-disulfide oxidoreductase YuxK
MLISGREPHETRLSGRSQLSSLILIDDNAIYTESDAVLEILARLNPPWSWISPLRIISQCSTRHLLPLHRTSPVPMVRTN